MQRTKISTRKIHRMSKKFLVEVASELCRMGGKLSLDQTAKTDDQRSKFKAVESEKR